MIKNILSNDIKRLICGGQSTKDYMYEGCNCICVSKFQGGSMSDVGLNFGPRSLGILPNADVCSEVCEISSSGITPKVWTMYDCYDVKINLKKCWAPQN